MARPWGDGINVHSLRSMLLASSVRPRLFTNRFARVVVLMFLTFSVILGFWHWSAEAPFGRDILEGLDLLSSTKDGNVTLYALAPSYIKAIMSPDDKTFSQAECPGLKAGRYDYLRSNSDASATSDTKYFFALDLYQSASIIPRLLSSVVEAMNFLGPEKCTLSIVEGHSTDGTYEILKLLRTAIEQIGATYYFVSSDLNSRVGERIEVLAKLRNLALEPLIQSANMDKTTVVFLNDVAICSEDILELVHQRLQQKADMTCPMDWTYVGQDPTFYDVWIARGMTGDTFFNIPEDGNWNSAWNLFWNDPTAQSSLNEHKPFQVFSCWNGAVVFAGEILKKIKFRHSTPNECHQGEPKLFCKDMWYNGYGKIAVIPSVSIIYSDDAMRRIKALKGFTSDWTDKEGEGQQIEWNEKPPDLVKCMRNYSDQPWLPWNESLAL